MSGVIRFENSPFMSVSLTEGSMPVFWCDTVGSESSSATNGSSVVIVAGKKRFPTIPWLIAGTVEDKVSAVASARRTPASKRSIGVPQNEGKPGARRPAAVAAMLTSADEGREAYASFGGARARGVVAG